MPGRGTDAMSPWREPRGPWGWLWIIGIAVDAIIIAAGAIKYVRS